MYNLYQSWNNLPSGRRESLPQWMYEEMQIRNYSPRSIENYISHVSLVSSHFGKSPEHISIAKIKEYLFHKVETKNLSASSINQTISAFKIFIRDLLGRDWDPVKIKRPKPLPAVFYKEEISHTAGNDYEKHGFSK